MVVGRGFELDLGLEAILFLIVAEHAIESPVHGVVIDVRDLPEMRVGAEFIYRHAGIARDRDFADARTRPRDHAKRDVGELLPGTGGDILRDDRFEIAVLLEHGSHLLCSAHHFFLGQAGSRIQLGGPLQLHIHGGAGGSVHPYASDKSARSAGKNQSHAVGQARAPSLDGVVEARGIQLAQAVFQVLLRQRRSFSLGQMAGERQQLIGRNALERNAANGQALPLENGVGRLNGRFRGPGRRCALRAAGCGSGLRRRSGGRRLAPSAERCAARNQKDGDEQNSGARPAECQILPLL
jgi:hypothetical protein